MERRACIAIAPVLVALPLVLAAPGCATPPTSAPRIGAPETAAAPAPGPADEAPREVPLHRRPSRAGEYLVYPCQWRKAEELGARLYYLLYPKYGPYLQIVPDPNQNALLIYLPPRASRYQGGADERL